MATLVTLDQAKAHLSQAWAAGDPREADLQLKLDVAEAAITRYCGNDNVYWQPIVDAWTSTTVPLEVKAAILILTGELWRFRGDDAAPEVPARDPATDFSPLLIGLLRRWRDPAAA